ncbi:hypothetical protein ACLBXM_13965 [Xanthobacteraceae bacterium A53D]
MPLSEDAFASLSHALSARGIHIDCNDLAALHHLSQRDGALGVRIDEDITLDVVDGSGVWTRTYPGLWRKIAGTLTITAPDNGNIWQCRAMDGDTCIHNGPARPHIPVMLAYQTGFSVSLKVSVINLSDPSYTGPLKISARLTV